MDTATLTVEVGRADKGDVDSEVSVVRRAVETQVYTKRDRGPRRVLLAAVKAYLFAQYMQFSLWLRSGRALRSWS